MTSRATTPSTLVLRGVLYTLRRRCGKPNCRCATGAAHESPALAYPEGGRTKTLTLGASEVREVAAALRRYEKAKGELDRQASAGVAALRRRRGATSRRGGPS